MTIERVLATVAAAGLVLATTAALRDAEGAQRPAGDTTLVSFFHQPDRLTRSYFLHLPPGYDSARPLPLVLVLHPALANGQWMEAETGWSELADRESFIVVYPNGTRGRATWPAQRSLLWNGAYRLRCAPPMIPDDEGFLVQIIEQALARYRVDVDRVYMTGFSHGAQMTSSFAFPHADLLAGIAPVSGGWLDAWTGSPGFDCMASSDEIAMSHPLPIWIWRGSLEQMVNNPKGMTRAEQDQRQKTWYIAANRAARDPVIETERVTALARSGARRIYTLRTEQYSAAAGGADVYFTEVSPEGHRWQPGATEHLWAFFKARRRSSEADRGPSR